MNESVPAALVLKVTIPWEPAVKQRPMFSTRRRSHAYTPLKTREAQEAISTHLRFSFPKLVLNDETAFGVQAVFYTRTFQKRDLDNMLKLLLDACTGIIWADDKQVEEIQCRVERGVEEARTELIIYIVSEVGKWIFEGHCKQCGKAFRTSAAWTRKVKTNPKYCGRQCRIDSTRTMLERICPVCRIVFRTVPARLKYKTHYCSNKCQGVAMRKPQVKPVSFAGKLCRNGHERTLENSYGDGCRICHRMRMKKYRIRRKQRVAVAA